MQFEALLQKFTEAVERGVGSRLADLFCEDGVYHDGFTVRSRGAWRFLRCWSSIFTAMPRTLHGG